MSANIVAIVGGTLIDGTGTEPVPDTTLIVRGAHVCSVGSRIGTPIPENAIVLDARNRTVLPGLIDQPKCTRAAATLSRLYGLREVGRHLSR